MKIGYPTIFLLSFLSFLYACKDYDPKPDYDSDQYVNHWIYDNMSIYYLWNDRLPNKPDYNQQPDDFFESILYKYDERVTPDGDRFSWIMENYVDLLNYLSGISSDEIGFEYILWRTANEENLIGEIQYVKRNTPAASVGLKRGQFFSAVNGISLNMQNYQMLTQIQGDYTLTVHDVSVEDGALVILSTETKSIRSLSRYAENPVYLDTIYSIGNSKIAYLVYNFFADDENDDSWSYLTRLKQSFVQFQNQDVTDMVLDLRYNTGGSMHAAQWLASMLIREGSSGEVFLMGQYNKLVTSAIVQEGGAEVLNARFLHQDDQAGITHTLPQLGDKLNRLIVLTGSHTASASELLICGLRPYKDIQLLGETTIGKSVGSITIHDEDHPENTWGMQPIIVRFCNARFDTFNVGLEPDYLNEDDSYPKLELGDINENLLHQAISIITGNTALRNEKRQSPLLSARKVSSSISTKPGANQAIVNLKITDFILSKKTIPLSKKEYHDSK